MSSLLPEPLENLNVTNVSPDETMETINLLKKRDHIIIDIDDSVTGIKTVGFEVTMPLVGNEEFKKDISGYTEEKKNELKMNLLNDIMEFIAFLLNDQGYKPTNEQLMEFGVDTIIAAELGIPGIKIDKIVRTGAVLHPINKHQDNKVPIYHGQVMIREVELQ